MSSQIIASDWKARLYSGYVSSGQASTSDRKTDTPSRFFAPRAAHIRNIIGQHFSRDRSVRVLDLACGHGAYLYYLKAAGYTNISGVDISGEQIEVAHRLGVADARHGDILTELKSTQSGTIGAVLLMDILEHLEIENLFEVLDEVFRVLTTGGKCVAHMPNAEGLYGMRVRYGDMTHERAFVSKSARQLFSTIGFRSVQCFEDVPKIHGVKSLVRRIIWDFGTAWHRLLLFAETGSRGVILSQNLLVVAHKGTL